MGLQTPIQGRGGGSFANDPSVVDRSMVNARMVTTRWLAEKEVFRSEKGSRRVSRFKKTTSERRGIDESHEILPVVALQVFVSCDRVEWKRTRMRSSTYLILFCLYSFVLSGDCWYLPWGWNFCGLQSCNSKKIAHTKLECIWLFVWTAKESNAKRYWRNPSQFLFWSTRCHNFRVIDQQDLTILRWKLDHHQQQPMESISIHQMAKCVPSLPPSHSPRATFSHFAACVDCESIFFKKKWVTRVFNYSSEYFDLAHQRNGHEQLIGPPSVYPVYGGVCVCVCVCVVCFLLCVQLFVRSSILCYSIFDLLVQIYRFSWRMGPFKSYGQYGSTRVTVQHTCLCYRRWYLRDNDTWLCGTCIVCLTNSQLHFVGCLLGGSFSDRTIILHDFHRPRFMWSRQLVIVTLRYTVVGLMPTNCTRGLEFSAHRSYNWNNAAIWSWSSWIDEVSQIGRWSVFPPNESYWMKWYSQWPASSHKK